MQSSLEKRAMSNGTTMNSKTCTWAFCRNKGRSNYPNIALIPLR
jgi:hypothetical protein